MREEAAALVPSTARNALVMAMAILVASYGVTVPFRRMTFNKPGALAVISLVISGVAGLLTLGRLIVAVLMSSSRAIILCFLSDRAGPNRPLPTAIQFRPTYKM